MDKHTEMEQESYANEESAPRKADPIVIALAVMGGLVLTPFVSAALLIAVKLTLGLVAGVIGLACGLVSLAIGLACGMLGLALGPIGAVPGLLVSPPGLVLIALVIWARSRE